MHFTEEKKMYAGSEWHEGGNDDRIVIFLNFLNSFKLFFGGNGLCRALARPAISIINACCPCTYTSLTADCSPILTVQPGHCDWVIHQSCWQLRDDVIYKSLVQCFLLEWLRRLMLSGPGLVWQIVRMQITKRIAQDLIELNKMNISCRMMHIARLMTFTLFGCKTMM